ncbi:hypothetical protein [Paracoccus hibiscisoli]|uniref:hypothetical protein n=1 Tax=Paracoccus hibiscisoli TaxID=2023261 RepID=UPI0023F1C0F8|nr:hypothetical protein [Paracoccus hibiscisoli]
MFSDTSKGGQCFVAAQTLSVLSSDRLTPLDKQSAVSCDRITLHLPLGVTSLHDPQTFCDIWLMGTVTGSVRGQLRGQPNESRHKRVSAIRDRNRDFSRESRAAALSPQCGQAVMGAAGQRIGLVIVARQGR